MDNSQPDQQQEDLNRQQALHGHNDTRIGLLPQPTGNFFRSYTSPPPYRPPLTTSPQSGQPRNNAYDPPAQPRNNAYDPPAQPRNNAYDPGCNIVYRYKKARPADPTEDFADTYLDSFIEQLHDRIRQLKKRSISIVEDVHKELDEIHKLKKQRANLKAQYYKSVKYRNDLLKLHAASSEAPTKQTVDHTGRNINNAINIDTEEAQQ